MFAAFGGTAAGNLLDTQRHNLPTAQVDALQETFVGALHAAFIICAAVAAIGVVTALVRGREKPVVG